MTPYDEAKHRRELGLAQVHAIMTEATVEAPLDLIGHLEGQPDFLGDDAEEGHDAAAPPSF